MSSISVYQLGQVLRATGIFDQTPSTISLVVNPPSGPVKYEYESPEGLIKLGDADLNSYYADLDINEAGTWYYEWKSTGTGQAVQRRQFVVVNTDAPEPEA